MIRKVRKIRHFYSIKVVSWKTWSKLKLFSTVSLYEYFIPFLGLNDNDIGMINLMLIVSVKDKIIK